MTKFFVAIMFSCLALSEPAIPQVLQSNTPLNPGNRQYIYGEVPEVIQRLGLQPKNRMEGSKQLNLVIGLPLHNQDALQKLMHDIYDPSGSKYHKYLSPEEFTQQFGPSEQDYQALIAFAGANHLKVTATHKSKMLLEVSGNAADIENVFHVHMFEYKRLESDETFYAPDVDPSIDLAVSIQQIKGLNNYDFFYPNSVFKKIKSNNSAIPNDGSGLAGLYIGNDFRNAYAKGVSLTGSGQIVGLLQFDGYNASDIINYELAANTPETVTLQNILIGGVKGTPITSNGRGEVTLDIDMTIAMAPGLTKVVIFEAPNQGQYFDVLLDSMSAHSEIKQFSTSWALGSDGVDKTADGYFEKMAVQGQSFFCASGDYDAYSSNSYTKNGKKLTSSPGFPESDTNITDVGGTTLGMNSNGASWAYDSVWNTGYDSQENLYLGSSGGISTTYTIPSWQKSVSTANNNRSTNYRNIPDVALTADNVYLSLGDTVYIASGTSCASPLWAGFTALVNQQAAAEGGQTVGFMNPAVYAIGNGSSYTKDFHDVTLGNNFWPGSPTLYNAINGYDLTTGWGTPNGQNLIDDLTGFPPGQLTNGTASPTSGTITTQFSFSANYQSSTGQSPDSVYVIIDNKSYKMTAQGSDWINGVTFNFSYPAFFTTGQHNYYFTGSIAGSVSIRYPSTGALQFNIGTVTPGVVQQASPLNKSIGNIQPVELKWLSSAGAASYHLQLSTDSTFLTTIKDTTGVPDTVFTAGSLSNLTTYYWHVNAANTAGTSAWSTVWSFRTLGNPTQAVLIYPANNSVNIPVAVNFLWNRSQDQLEMANMKEILKDARSISKAGSKGKKNTANVSAYRFELTTDTTNLNFVEDDSTLTDTTTLITGLQYLTNYWWRVSAMNQAGWGAFTNWSTFTTIIDTPFVVQLVSPIKGSSGNVRPVKLEWMSSARAGSYSIEVGTDSTFATTTLNISGWPDTTYIISGLINLTTYYWRINAINIGGTSAWSQVWNFKTLGDPTQANIVYPANNSIDIPVTVNFIWNQSQDQLMKSKRNGYMKNFNIISAESKGKSFPANVSGYGFELLTDTTSTNYVVNDSIITDTTVQVTGLKNLTNYWWRVRAMNQAGWGAFTSWSKFTTIIDTPGVAVLLSPNSSSIILDTAKSILFSWMSTLYASTYELQIATDNKFSTVLLDSAGIADTLFTYHSKILTSAFYWKVQASNTAGPGQWSAVMNVSVIAGINNIKNGVPVVYNLYQNYPNPFNPSTMIIFALPFSSKVKIEVYNLLGEKVRELVNEQKTAGYYEVYFNTTGLASGVYLYMIEAKSTDGKSEYVNTKKMMLMK
jgi:hypothetical protein